MLEVYSQTKMHIEHYWIKPSYPIQLIAVDNFENMSTKEIIATLKAVGRIVAIDSHRIHSIINTFDLAEIISVTTSSPQCFNLINTIDYLPTIDGPLLTKFIHQRANELERVSNAKEITTIEEETGGVLFLTKELIRGNQDLLSIKIQTLWNRLNDASKNALMCYLTNSKSSSKDQKIIEQFSKQNILKLKVFTNHLNLLVSNP